MHERADALFTRLSLKDMSGIDIASPRVTVILYRDGTEAAFHSWHGKAALVPCAAGSSLEATNINGTARRGGHKETEREGRTGFALLWWLPLFVRIR